MAAPRGMVARPSRGSEHARVKPRLRVLHRVRTVRHRGCDALEARTRQQQPDGRPSPKVSAMNPLRRLRRAGGVHLLWLGPLDRARASGRRRHMVGGNFGDRGPEAHVDAAPAQPGEGVVRELGRELHRNAWSSLDYCPAHRVGVKPTVLAHGPHGRACVLAQPVPARCHHRRRRRTSQEPCERSASSGRRGEL